MVLILASGKVEQNVIDLGAAVDDATLAGLRQVFLGGLQRAGGVQAPRYRGRIP